MATRKTILAVICIGLVGLAVTGCSDDTDTPTAIPADSAPPAVPANLQLDYDGSAAFLSWDANTVDADLAGYVIVRENNGNAQTISTSPQIHHYVDVNPPLGATIYQVSAVDAAGNRSAVATVYLTVSGTHRPDLAE
jgi:hypothetical protein